LEKKAVKHFTDLLVWQKARELRKEVFSLVKKLPQNEKYNLDFQMRRAACSITANLAEGYGRYHYKENIQFCRQSRGSIYELQDHIITCFDQGYIKEETYNSLQELILEVIRLMDGYIKFLNNELKKS